MSIVTTRREIEMAITRIEAGRTKRIARGRPLSISAVAAEADVSNATIHNRYPDLAERIRELTAKTTQARVKAQQAELRAAVEAKSDLRAQLTQSEQDLKLLAVANYRLAEENKQLQRVVSMLEEQLADLRRRQPAEICVRAVR